MTPEELLEVLRNSNCQGVTLEFVKTTIDNIVLEDNRKESMRLKAQERALDDIYKYRAKTLYYAAKSRAQQKQIKTGRKVPFDIDIPWIEERLRRGICEVSGTQLYIKEYTKKNPEYAPINPRSASLDQIIPGAGYTKHNTRVICDCLNKMFSDKSDGAVYDVVKSWVKEHENKYSIRI